jgi:hypothetical protein
MYFTLPPFFALAFVQVKLALDDAKIEALQLKGSVHAKVGMLLTS